MGTLTTTGRHGNVFAAVFLAVCLVYVTPGCSVDYRDDLDYSYGVVASWQVQEIESGELVQFESVHVDLVADALICEAIAEQKIAATRDVLHIGSGTGLIASMCLVYEADSVVVTDINPVAIANTRYNVAALAPGRSLRSRLRPASQSNAFSAIQDNETFDLILTNLDQDHRHDGANLPADQEKFLISFLDQLPNHLTTGGRAVVIVQRKETAQQLLEQANKAGRKVASMEKDFQNRDWQTLKEPFLPSVLFEVR